MKRREGAPRRGPVRARKRTVLVYCGGVRTEPAYFDGLKRAIRSQNLTVRIRHGAVSPPRLVQLAAAHRDRRPDAFDEVWCVVDVDDFDIAAAVAEAARSRVSLAVSNPCFEVWLLLHHADCRSYCNGYPDVAARLKRYVPAYDKAALRFGDYAAGVEGALKRARELDPTGRDHGRNPSTGVWRLVETLMESS